MRPLTALCALVSFALAAAGQAPDNAIRARQLKAEIAKLERRLDKLNRELAALDPTAAAGGAATMTRLDPRPLLDVLHLRAGQTGRLEGEFEVRRAWNSAVFMYVRAIDRGGSGRKRSTVEFAVRYPAEELTNGMKVRLPGMWKVTGPVRGDRLMSYYFLEPVKE